VKPRAWLIAALVVSAVLAYAGYRLVLHASRLQPAIVTPKMDAQQAISSSFSGHIKRLLREHIEYANRAQRPKLIALTFDDGPYPIFTPLLIDELHKLDVPGTFFLIGRDAQQWPELTQRIEQSGNEIADHTYTHPNLDQESPAQVREEIVKGREALWNLVHDPALRDLFRPPHGRYTLETIEVAQSLGYKTVLWTDDGGDWRTITSQTLADHLEQHATAPEIVLLHSGKLATIEMLPEVVARFRAAGYQFVTVGELLRHVTAAELNHPAKKPV
jgi:peptidoglycan/xylan/chitin deacetylase (PgdA/CDA1 family)